MAADNSLRRLRLAQVVTRMDIGGVPDHVMTLIGGLRREMDITLICGSIDDTHRRTLVAMNIPVEIVPFRRLLHPLVDIRTFQALYKHYRERKFDIVHTHTSKAALIGAIAAVAARIPVIVNTAHNLGFIAMPKRMLKVLFWIYDFVLLRSTTDAVITVSTKVRQQALAARLLSPLGVFAVHNGISRQKMQVSAADAQARRLEFRATPDEVLIVCVARLVWFKGLDTLVSALALLLQQHPGVRVVVAGDGPLHQQLAAQADSLGISNSFILSGERRDIPAILAAADIFVLPSVSEGLPISIMEAMASAKPVVATDVGGVAELVDHNITGLLVPPASPVALAQALERLVQDKPLRMRMGTAGQNRIDSEFSPHKMAQATAAIYHACLARKGGST